MDMKDSLVKGGVLIAHQIHEGKHQYEVENVVKYKTDVGGNFFVRKGDKLMLINGIDLKDVTPEELVAALADGNPMLTVHKPAREKGVTPSQTPPTKDTLQPVSTESTTLNFGWEMTRQEDSEENEVEQGEEKETEDLEEDICREKTDSEMLIVEMTKTSISLVRGRGCDETGCTLNDIIMVAESRTVTLVPRGGSSFRLEKFSNVLIEHVATRHYLRAVSSPSSTIYASPNPEKITIYYYKSNGIRWGSTGMPVVLNLTDSNCFLKCCKQADRIILKLETCERERLKQISKSDESALSFMFYMKGDVVRRRKFESALHRGWYINVFNTDSVGMAAMDGHTESQSFVFIIQK